jgi:hypothetical protein
VDEITALTKIGTLMAEVGSIVVNLFAQVADHEQTKIGHVYVPIELHGSPFGNLDNVALNIQPFRENFAQALRHAADKIDGKS